EVEHLHDLLGRQEADGSGAADEGEVEGRIGSHLLRHQVEIARPEREVPRPPPRRRVPDEEPERPVDLVVAEGGAHLPDALEARALDDLREGGAEVEFAVDDFHAYRGKGTVGPPEAASST